MPEDQSPYRPPSSNVEAEAPLYGELVNAGLGRRFTNFVIDAFGQLLLMVSAVSAVAIVFGERAVGWYLGLPDYVVGATVAIAYYAGFEGTLGRTPAKFVTGTRVLNEDGTRPSFLRVAGRSLARLIPFEPLSFFRISDIHKVGRGWHDTLTKTRVVMTRSE